MEERNYSRKLKKSLILYSMFAICVIGLTVAFIAVYPLYGRLRDEQRRHLLHNLVIKRMIVDEYLSRARDTALQVTSRTQIRKKLAAFNRGEVPLDELVEFSGPKLADAMNLSEDMVGITRLDEGGTAVIEVGRPVAPQWRPRPARGERRVPIRGPLALDGKAHIVLGANILDRDGTHVGTDIVLFRTRGLRNIIEDRVELGPGGETILCYREGEGLRLFFDPDGGENRPDADLLAALTEDGPEATQSPKVGTYTADAGKGSTKVYAYSGLEGTGWILVLMMDQGELFRAVNRQILYIGSAIAFFLALGIFGMTLILRPLAGRILVHTEELERQNVELKKLDAVKDGLIRDVSHELKTPVAKQAMQLEILKPIVEKHSLDPRERKAIRVMEETLSRQQLVIRNLLDLSRLESGGREFSLSPVHLDRLLEQIREDYQHAIEEYGIDFQINVTPGTLVSDSEMLWHVFSNLVNNAIKFRRETAPSIAVSSRWTDSEVQVRIADNGVGLSGEQREKAFSRFYQVTASSEGSGVGLSIARRIIEELGGSIGLESPGPGRGTTAVVSLPLKP